MKKSLLMFLSIVCVSFFFANCGDDPVTPTPTPTPTPTSTYRDVSYVVVTNDSIFDFVDISFKFLHKDKSMSHDTITVPMSGMSLTNDPSEKKDWTKQIRSGRRFLTLANGKDTTFHFYAYTFTHIPVGDVLECTDFIATAKKDRPNVPDVIFLCNSCWPPYELYGTTWHDGIENKDTTINKFFKIISKGYKSSYTVK